METALEKLQIADGDEPAQTVPSKPADVTSADGVAVTDGSGSSKGGSSSRAVSYAAERVIGNGSFGVVFLARVLGTGESVAIKKVLQERKYKNRELQIMRTLSHPNIVQLKHYFYSSGGKPNDVYLNLVLEYVPQTVYRFYRSYIKAHSHVPVFFVRLFMYQLARSLSYLHSLGICHRDIKPQNLLIDPQTGVLKLCDFGSAKALVAGEPNVSYICSRYYRAPELVFGATKYTTHIDTWSMGCVLAEMLTGSPLFPGQSSVDQLVEIIKVLGTPTREQVEEMNRNYIAYRFPQIKACSWRKVLRSHVPESAVDLLSKIMRYTPTSRLTPAEVCAHPFFDELRAPCLRMPDGRPLPPLFDWTADELRVVEDPAVREVLVPQHVRRGAAPVT